MVPFLTICHVRILAGRCLNRYLFISKHKGVNGYKPSPNLTYPNHFSTFLCTVIGNHHSPHRRPQNIGHSCRVLGFVIAAPSIFFKGSNGALLFAPVLRFTLVSLWHLYKGSLHSIPYSTIVFLVAACGMPVSFFFHEPFAL